MKGASYSARRTAAVAVVMFAVAAAAAGGEINVAPLGTASQSSTCYGMGPERAIDGDFKNFTHTCNTDTNATWQVDLGTPYAISSNWEFFRTVPLNSRSTWLH